MTDETKDNIPNWLSELEKKRERRLKTRLGHEAGAGAPCIKCEAKCPGLDLHFWRKICKNCKCSKEDHDCHDDDIYGWAQFQLLGSKPNKTIKKIVLPGKKDEVELEWAPKGNAETINRFLKTLSPETLPVKGSPAAQERKQLLQKQIPIHDIDPTLCHDLTESELAQMENYVKHLKNSAGIGQVIQLGVNYGNLHVFDETNAQFIRNRCANKEIPTVESVQLIGGGTVEPLTKQLQNIDINDQRELDAFFDKIPNPLNMSAISEQKSVAPFFSQDLLVNNPSEINRNLPHYASSQLNIEAEEQRPAKIGNIRDLALSTYDDNKKKGATDLHPCPQLPHQIIENEATPTPVGIGAIHDITYDDNVNLPSYVIDNDKNQSDSTKIRQKNAERCRKCSKTFKQDEFAILVEKSNLLYHSSCFRCRGCNQSLADMFYFYDKESDDVYCGRDWAKIRGIPRCQACDELIFVKEYCLAENCTFHLKHFCCFECDQALAGQNYVVEDSQPVCLPCFEKVKANRCVCCGNVIGADEQGLMLGEGIHFHAADSCFCCSVCKRALHGGKLLFRQEKLFCSHECFNNQ